MGYATRFSLHINGNAPANVIAALRGTYEGAAYALTKSGDQNEPCKWYDHEEEMATFSKDYPEATFCLHGEGEEQGDVWNKEFQDGKLTRQRKMVKQMGPWQ